MAAGRLLLTLAAVLAAAPVHAAAQAAPDTAAVRRAPRPYVPPRVALSITAGTIALGELQSQRVTAERLTATPGSQLLERTLAAEDGLQVGASALLALTPAWAVRVGGAWGAATLVDGYEGEDAWESDVEGLPVGASSDLNVLSAEAALRFRMRSGKRVQPYAELGVAGVRLEAEDPAFPGAEGLTGDTRIAGLAGLGAVIPVWRRLAGRVQATVQLFRTPATPAAAGSAVAAGDTLQVTFVAPLAGPFADPARELLRATRLDVGLSIELGSAARGRGAPAARPSGSPPSPGS